MSVLDKALLEHNIVAIKKIYETMTFDNLSRLLDIKSDTVKRFINIYTIIRILLNIL